MSTRAPRRAAVDVGTNSVRLLVADLPGWTPGVAAHLSSAGAPSVSVRPVLRRLSITRLGDGLEATNTIRPGPAARTAVAVEEFAAAAYRIGAPNPVVLATYVLRAARNPQELLSRLQRPVRILSGEEEARMGFFGAVAALAPRQVAPGVLVIDIGGGSVELTWGTLRAIEGAQSVQLGCVLLTHRFIAHDPPEPQELDAIRQQVDDVLGPLLERLRGIRHAVIGVGGTITTMAALDLRLEPYDPEKVHGHRLVSDKVRAIVKELTSRTLQQRQAMPGLQPERADVIIAGAVVLQRILEGLGDRAVQASEADLLWAALLGY